MVFSSIPAYLDPSNWQQQQPNNQQNGSNSHATGVGVGVGVGSHHQSSLPAPPPPPPPHQPHGSGSVRPGSMADRARLANIPMPEGPLKCPRCESTNTKFCYFNNYSLSQPRHFCKTCRRYWTRGGALRSVPVGGGCRRNKRSKGSSSSKSSDCQRSTGSGSSSSSISMPPIGSTAEILGLASSQVTPLRLMAPLHSLTDFGAGEIGLNYGGIGMHPHMGGAGSDLNFHLGSALGGGGGGGGGGVSLFHQPSQQLPFLGGGLDPSSGLYSFDGGVYGGGSNAPARGKPPVPASAVLTQLASVKMEDNNNNNNNNHDLNLSRQFMGINTNSSAGNEQYWSRGGGTSSAWTDLSGFSSSSTSNAL